MKSPRQARSERAGVLQRRRTRLLSRIQVPDSGSEHNRGIPEDGGQQRDKIPARPDRSRNALRTSLHAGHRSPERRKIADNLVFHLGRTHRGAGTRKGREKPNLTDAIFNGKAPARTRFFSPAILYKWVYGIYDHVTKVETRPEQTLPWAVDYKTDYYAYFRNTSGKEYGRPRTGFGIVNFRIAGAPADPCAVWQAKAPWSPLSADLRTRSGAKIENQTLTFDEGMDVSRAP